MDKNRKNAFTFAEKRHSEANAEESPFWRCFGFHPQHDRLAAFTFAELMVSLVIISVITALLYPVIANIAPNNNKQLYRSAYKTVESVMQDIITSEGNNTNGVFNTVECDDNGAGVCINQDAIDAANANAGNAISHTLCQEFQKRLNTVKWTFQGNNDSSGCDNNAPQELHTSNGMRWWFQEAKPCTNDNRSTCFTIYVDVNASNNGENFNNVPCAEADCAAPFDDPASFGTNGSWTKGCFRQHDDNGRDTFKIEVQSNGRVNPAVDQIGIRHLRNESLDQQQ